MLIMAWRKIKTLLLSVIKGKKVETKILGFWNHSIVMIST